MNYKLLVGVLGIPWAVAAFLTGILYMNGNLAGSAEGDTAAVAEYYNITGNPNESRVSVPAVGGTNNPIGVEISYPTTGIGWLKNLAHSLTLTGPIWPEWTQPFRFFMYVLVSPALLMVTIAMAQAFSFFISSIFGRGSV